MLDIFNTTQLGAIAEQKACIFLQAKGLRLVTRNYHSPYGEIDLIMQDKDEIVFIEVRSKKQSYYGSAIESIDKIKQRKVLKSASYYLQRHKVLHTTNCRFDVIGCSPTTIEWIKDAFADE
jgi:putative endonuclease